MAISTLTFEGISAVTYFVSDMARSVPFYQSLGFEVVYGGADSPFTSFSIGPSFVNIAVGEVPANLWGRTIIYVSDVDAMYQRALDAGHTPEMPPSDAPWRERYFHLRDPDGNELSFARPLTDA